MDWGAIGAVGEIIGAAAVFITLLYLATQVRQTNDISRFNTTKDLNASFDNLNKMIVSDPSLREVLHKTGELSDTENEQLYTFANMWCNTWALCQVAFDNDLTDASLYEAASRDVPFELQRWPNFRRCVNLWLERYPELREMAIFSPAIEKS